MTRRKVLFRDVESGKCYVTPEFNGDKSELLLAKSADSCAKDWDEIFQEFKNVRTFEEFKKVNEQAQRYYKSSLTPKPEILPVEDVGKNGFEESDLVIEELFV